MIKKLVINIAILLFYSNFSNAQKIKANCELNKTDSLFNYYRLFINNNLIDTSIIFFFSSELKINFDSDNSFAGRNEGVKYVIYTSIEDKTLENVTKSNVLFSNSNMYLNIKVLKKNVNDLSIDFIFTYSKISNSIIANVLSTGPINLEKLIRKDKLLKEELVVIY